MILPVATSASNASGAVRIVQASPGGSVTIDGLAVALG